MSDTAQFNADALRRASRPSLLATLTVLLSLILIGLFGSLQFQDVQAGKRVARAVEQSNLRHRLISDYFAVLQDIETGQRGFVMTGQNDFLQPQVRAQSIAGSLERSLLKAYSPLNAELPAVTELISVGRAKQARSQRVISIRREQGEQVAAAAIASGQGKRIMDRARQLVATLERREAENERRLLVDAASARQQRQREILLTELALIVSVAGLFFAIAQSIAELRRSSQALADSATRQSAIFEAANDAMVILDAQGIITSMNGAAERLFGHPRNEMLGRSNLSLFADAPTQEVSQAYLRGVAREDGSVDPTQTFTGARADGSTFETEVATTSVTLQDGRHFLAVARDATERRRIERLKNEFVATVSHELRTPLTSIAGSLGLLVGGAAGPLPDKASRLLGIAHTNSQRLIRLINDILDIEKIEAGKMSFAPKLLDLDMLLSQSIHDSSGLAAERDVTLTLMAVPHNSTVFADPDRMGQVLANLLSNAIKYSPIGGTVTISTERQHLHQRISIIDEGAGIPDAFRDRIFQKFAQADSTDTRLVGGTGLGLSIVRELVTRSDGAVSFESTPGNGTAFHVDLPAQTIVSTEAIDADVLQPPSDLGGPHLLHVDNDPDTLRLVAQAFDKRFEVHSTPSIHEGAAALRRFRFDLVILDLAMNDGSGIDLVPAVRASCGSCPIILFTAYDVESADAAKVDAVCVKSRDDLEKLVGVADRLTSPTAGAKTA